MARVTSFSRSLRNSRNVFQPRETRKRADFFLYKIVPHGAVSGDWKTFLLFRNDRENEVTLAIDFYDPAGNLVEATFFDADENQYTATGIDLGLPSFGMNTIEFDTISNSDLRSLQVFVFAEGETQEFSVETLIHNFQGSEKVATVGVIDQPPDFNFFMNVDRRFDPYTLNQKIRGLAVTNTAIDSCFCNIFIWDDFGNPAGTDLPLLVEIPPSGKLLGSLDGILGQMDVRLPFGLGVIAFECDRQVSALGLAFEPGTPIVGSIPIDYFIIENGKRVIRK